MKEIYIKSPSEIPERFAGKIIFVNSGTIFYVNDVVVCARSDDISDYELYNEYTFHNRTGPSIIFNGESQYHLNGIYFNKEDWFNNLSSEEHIIALMNPENFLYRSKS